MIPQTQVGASRSSALRGALGIPNPVVWPGRAAFLDMISRRPMDTDTIQVVNAPLDEIRDLLGWAERHRNPRFTLLFYDSHSQDGIVRALSSPHEVASDYIKFGVRDIISANGYNDFIEFHGSATTESTDGRFMAQPDASLVPASRNHQPGTTFPSVMIEIGKTQSHPSLRRVMRGWFEMSGGQVKIVILVDIRRRQSGNHEIVFEKWRYPGDRPVCDTNLSVILSPGFQHPGAQYNYQPGDFIVTVSPESAPLPMVLEFDLVCDRAPGPGEQDLLLPDAFFRYVASWVWRVL